MIKTIVFWVGVDVLGFPLLHTHRLKFQTRSPQTNYVLGYDGHGELSNSIGATTYSSGRVVIHNKNTLKK